MPTGGDVYLLSNVLHDWDDAAATTILRTVRAAMQPDARLLIVENVLDAPGRTASQQRDVHLVDLHMLVMFGARSARKAEYDALLVAAGFAPVQAQPLAEHLERAGVAASIVTSCGPRAARRTSPPHHLGPLHLHVSLSSPETVLVWTSSPPPA